MRHNEIINGQIYKLAVYNILTWGWDNGPITTALKGKWRTPQDANGEQFKVLKIKNYNVVTGYLLSLPNVQFDISSEYLEKDKSICYPVDEFGNMTSIKLEGSNG